MVRRRNRIAVSFAAVAALGTTVAACRRADSPVTFPGAPIVLISIDTLRSDRLPSYGYKAVETPALDRLRRDAILFSSAWSPCPMTLPAHATLLTGLAPPVHGVRANAGFRFDASAHPHVPGLLRARGYAAGAAVSTFVLRGETGFSALFDDYEDSLDPRVGLRFVDQQRPGTVTLRFAREWIDAHAARPFFYFFHIYEPHAPWEPPEPFRSRYGLSYDGEVAAADAVVGGLLEHLRATGLYDRALVVVTSDHGEGLGDHGEEQHSILLYREALQVPLLVKLPGQARAGETVREPVGLADVAATIAEAAGASLAPGTTARSVLRPLPSARALYAETLYPRLSLGWSDLRSIVDGRWHYIHGPRPELYDLAADPREERDLAARVPDAVARLKGSLDRVPEGPTTPARVDEATAERLAALGYVGAPKVRGAGGKNPRDELPRLAGLREGYRLAAERRFDEATARLADFVREQPANVEGWIKLGETALEAGRPADAIRAFEEALQRGGGGSDQVALQLGYARLRARDLAGADEVAARLESGSPGPARELRARVALARGRLDEALASADAAVRVRNPQPPAFLVGAEVRAARGDLAGALARVGDAEERARTLGFEAVRNLEAVRADALARLGRYAEADAAYAREVALFPGNVSAAANRAALLFALGRRADADAVLDRMVEANPGARGQAAARATREIVARAGRR